MWPSWREILSSYPFPRAIALNGFSMGLVKELLGPELWSEFEFTPAIHVGYVLNKEKMDEPFGLMRAHLSLMGRSWTMTTLDS